mmetsp:Transcript_6016/g.23139  ORF Transcript_6016/g.23139 Transcript_6016/m.23139 type:complete len:230 (+) Transcript_6016:356-1045(+)
MGTAASAPPRTWRATTTTIATSWRPSWPQSAARTRARNPSARRPSEPRPGRCHTRSAASSARWTRRRGSTRRSTSSPCSSGTRWTRSRRWLERWRSRRSPSTRSERYSYPPRARTGSRSSRSLRLYSRLASPGWMPRLRRRRLCPANWPSSRRWQRCSSRTRRVPRCCAWRPGWYVPRCSRPRRRCGSRFWRVDGRRRRPPQGSRRRLSRRMTATSRRESQGRRVPRSS